MNLYGNYDAAHGTLPISDDLIRAATSFVGWRRSYNDWPKVRGDCDNHPEHQAFHIRYLAATMLRVNHWVGCHPVAYSCGCLLAGNHRLRAAQFLAPLMIVNVPVQWTSGRCWKKDRCPNVQALHSTEASRLTIQAERTAAGDCFACRDE